MESIGTFPFGQPVNKVKQTDQSLKKVFVLGVYASAVHACWINPLGKTLVNALAVASEPYIFWRGDNVESILSEVKIPRELGTLIPPNQELNGPSGIALDMLILNPIGVDRDQAWMINMVNSTKQNLKIKIFMFFPLRTQGKSRSWVGHPRSGTRHIKIG